MGQFSVEKPVPPGSALSGNQQADLLRVAERQSACPDADSKAACGGRPPAADISGRQSRSGAGLQGARRRLRRARRTFDPTTLCALARRRRGEAIAFMDRLEIGLADGRQVIVPPGYGLADVVWIVFLARMEFAPSAARSESGRRFARYWRGMQARPSFVAADIWTRLDVGRLISGMLGFVR
jgi:hypothetical protein